MLPMHVGVLHRLAVHSSGPLHPLLVVPGIVPFALTLSFFV